MYRIDKIYYLYGNIKQKRWFKNNTLHRLVGPAYIGYYTSGIKCQIVWKKCGKTHRENGPAIINFNEDGSVLNKLYFINDICYSFTEWLKKSNFSAAKKVELKLKYDYPKRK